MSTVNKKKILHKLPKPALEVFEPVPVDQYFENNIEKMPEDLSPELKQKLLNDSKFWADHGMMTDVPKNLIDVLQNPSYKKAYPNYDSYIGHQAPKDTKKWISAVKDMYYKIHKGVEKGQALAQVIANWVPQEQLEFKHWLKFYNENTHKKYAENKMVQVKNAQVGYWEDINRAGYFVPVHQEQLPKIQDLDLAADPATNPQVQADGKREIIEAQRNKIVSRLDSAEKLLRSQEGQIFAGKEFEALMHIIYELKKKIHTVNKISTSTRLYEDMIVREANILNKKGYAGASNFLFKVADASPVLNPPQPANPMSGGGLTGTIPSPNNPPVNEGMGEFLDGLEGKQDHQPADDLEVVEDNDTNLIVEAQEAPKMAPKVPAPPKPTPADEGLEVNENDSVSSTSNPFDKKMEQMFQGIKVEDVVQKLEDLTKIYKTREMPRQLSLIDMMLDHLGLASFFPTLAEATNKSLDSNQYILTRLEDIASRLRGTVQTNEIDLSGQNPTPSSPELEATRNKLQTDQDKEKQRKEMRKQQQDNEAQTVSTEKPEPELEVEEDLGGPVDTATKVPAVPPPPVPAVPVK